MIISTTSRIEGRDIAATLGLVSGQVARSMPRPRRADMVASASPAQVEQVARLAEEEALARLREAATGIGAHAIAGVTVHFDTVDEQSGVLLCSARGTAVVLKDVKRR